jgi:hypothetical protein
MDELLGYAQELEGEHPEKAALLTPRLAGSLRP